MGIGSETSRQGYPTPPPVRWRAEDPKRPQGVGEEKPDGEGDRNRHQAGSIRPTRTVRQSEGRPACLSASRIELGESWFWLRKRRDSSTTTTLAPSTSSSA